MRLNAQICSALLCTALGIPTIALAEAEKQGPSTGDTTTGKAGVGATELLKGPGEVSADFVKHGKDLNPDRKSGKSLDTTTDSTSRGSVTNSGTGSGTTGGTTGSESSATTAQSGSGTMNSNTVDTSTLGTNPGTNNAVITPTTPQDVERSINRGTNWSWLGLLGLAGLFGLARKPETATRTNYMSGRSASAGTT